ncbi:C25 family cysteine peptidase [Rosettibacter firmus]|uniref:C25 family cysteine peptidase n=1 Tax=Rosettibacter firmus TaxID=3111522 RepID=UPI00336BED16
MNKQVLITFLLIVHFNCYSKDIRIKKIENGFEANIKFKQHDYIINEKNEIDFIFDEDESNYGSPKLPSKTLIFAIPPESKVNIEITDKNIIQLKDVNVSYNRKAEHLNDDVIDVQIDNKLLKKNISDIYPEEEFKIIGYTWIREYYCVIIQVNTHRYSFRDNNLFIIKSCNIRVIYDNQKNYFRNNEPVSKFDELLKNIIVNYEEAKEFRSFNKYVIDKSDWIDYSKNYIKIAIAEDNLYRITYDYLITHNIDPNLINPATIKAYLRGKEIPVYIKGEEDYQFDENDYIEFYCEKNYSYQDYKKIVKVGEDYIHYMDRYCDTSFVWLTWDGNYGKRIQLDKTNYTFIEDTINYHLVKLHLEEDTRLWYYDPTEPRVQLPFWQENKLYTWQVVGNSGSVNFNFNANDVLENSNLNVTARLISYAADIVNNASLKYNAHKYGMSLNSLNIQDTITFNYKETVNFSSTFNASQLKDGTNTIKITGLPTSVSFHQSLIDWVDVEYLRKNRAVNDSLLITIPDNLDKKLRVIKVENINSEKDEILVYKIHPVTKKFDNYILSGQTNKTLLIIDTVTGGDKYFITKLDNVDEPVFKYRKQFINLRSNSRAADYIIITNKSLTNSTNEYKNFITNSYNVKVELIYDEDIYDEFSYGQINAEAIRNFLIAAYYNWQSPKPSYLNIIGDANYDYKNVTFPAPDIRKKNLVISFGFPVSDIWYVIWDSISNAIPQMYVGRIPANNDDEVLNYLQKHKNYLIRKKDKFNKTFLFFSGGNTTRQSELDEIKNVNDLLYHKFVLSPPVYGTGKHFYKTLNPNTNFGPYTNEEFQNAIDEGGLFISYIGHSGTRTWDNGITEVEHIKNKYSDRFSLITDFGCSTGKFAEPDVDAFGELFVCQSVNAQAIAYLGNSSWGYLSTSLRFPKYFYDMFLSDSLKNIGYVHLSTKILQLLENGFNDVNRVFTYCNLLLGDPIVNLALPEKTNLVIDNSKIIIPKNITDNYDSVTVKIIINNYGLFNNDSIKIIVTDYFNNKISFEKLFKISLPEFEDSININIPVKNYAGEHKLKVELDIDNKINEIYEDDNIAELTFLVSSSSLMPLVPSKYFSVIQDTLKILNPLEKSTNDGEILLQIDDDYDFIAPIEIYKSLDTLITKIPLNNLNDNNRYYYRLKLNSSSNSFSDIYSFFKMKNESKIYIDNPKFNSEEFKYINTIYDEKDKCWKLNKRTISLIIKSAGWLDGSYGSILYDNQEQLPTTFYWGLAAAIIDSSTLKPVSVKYFLVPDAGVMDSVVNFINSLNDGTLIAMTISADAQQSILGSKNSKSRNAIKKLGSKYIDSVQYRDSWCMLGKKGAPAGSVPESYKKQLSGATQLEVSKEINYDSGFVIFPEISNSGKWEKIILSTEQPENSNLIYSITGIRSDGKIDTLNNFTTKKDTIDISSIDAKVYPELQLISKFISNTQNESPVIKSLTAYFSYLPELALNYQTVFISLDTIKQGEQINFKSKIYNVGETQTDSFRITLQLNRNNNSSITLLDTINNLKPFSYIPVSYIYTHKNEDGYGNFNFTLTVDKNNDVLELYENNNTFIKSFYVFKDTLTSVNLAEISVRFNGVEIQDRDYIDPDAYIQIELNQQLELSGKDSTLIKIFLDNKLISFNQLRNRSKIEYDAINKKTIISFYQKFDEGEHSLKIFIKNNFEDFSSLPVYEKYFLVTSELEMKNVYNIPNPFNNETCFIFVLTQIPDELKIRIYTVAGRLVKEIRIYNSELSTNLNTIFWDGRDEDGNLLANGVYFYKVIAKRGDKYSSMIQKLAIVR